ncbi:catalytic domain of component of various dehydrogenase complexes [Geobacter metallireducens RCH3]|uniref:Dihydrolipoamide acetyltransferase component of pyruvate dehydrogenase complex n=1 Tax=Geobacter metallireducens (strain ATCC 53774 / DSM 7210 / GS-15) TaxID=269799 RepID=Q39S04_GEOMG|nr:dihydrolipoamide acetyltransferase family protein [Geobacter metallireducens]ABB32970.1 pyruvate dehydrogenase complex, E2 protein, dihydrolipoamide acetyltransferase [Geobacter metallireducens GS-15]EHP88894.1 catalytic domain of component of various dehydrogenase complexes [Geobacter metallireducens RCH3]
MPTDITMPKLSDTMTEGRLVSWKKSVGERVERGEIIAEVETDKATMELEAFASGTLAEQRVKPGELVAVGTVIGVIGAGGEIPPVAPEKPTPSPEEPKPSPEESKPSPQKAEPQPTPEATPAAPAGDVPERVMELPEEKASAPAPPEAERGEGERAAPVVRRMARERGIDLSLVTGSGPEGRILQEDLERYLTEKPAPESAVATGEGAEGEPLSRMRGAIARVTSQAWQTIPHFYETVEIAMEEGVEIVRELKGSGNEVTFNDLVVKAAAMALAKYPRLNASFAGDRIVTHCEVNIGIAVAVDDGLLVPVVKGCQGLALKEIALETVRLADRARSGRISQEEISGGTFSISNLGMFGIDEFAAVIFPPQAAILAVGNVADRPVVRDGRVVAAKTMRVTLSCDHRIVDGAYAARFLGEFRRIVEKPVLMLLQ